MHLVDVAGFPPPEGAIVDTVAVDRRTSIRAARWVPAPGRASPGTVLICTGRSEFIEKYFDVIRNLRNRGFAVVVFDWRGQGLSSRSLRNRRKGHVDDFGDYGEDLEAVIEQVLRPFCPEPFFALAHSMGGAVAAQYIGTHAGVFDRVVLSAPMVEVHNLPFPRHLTLVTGSLAKLGFGGFFVPQGQRAAVFDRGFAGNVLTSDPTRFAAMMSFVQAAPELALGAPTIGWLCAAFRAMRQLSDFDFCRAIRTPVLVAVPTADRVVSVPAMERFAQRLKSGTLVRIPYARHEILMERDSLRNQFWAAFDAFVPGTTLAPMLQRKMQQ